MVVSVAGSISEYFSCLNEILPNQWALGSKGFIVSNGGIAVMIGLYQKILERIISIDLLKDEIVIII